MARTYSFRLNSEQVQILSEKFGVDPQTNELGLKAKQIVLSDGDFSQVVQEEKQTKKQKIDNFIEETPISEIKEKAKELTMTEIKQILNLNGKNRSNKIDQKGLYGEKNLEQYLRKIVRSGVDFDKSQEYITQIALKTKEEFLMQEYSARQTI